LRHNFFSYSFSEDEEEEEEEEDEYIRDQVQLPFTTTEEFMGLF